MSDDPCEGCSGDCEACGINVPRLPYDETLKCPACGYDFGIPVGDPYADPTCPNCSAPSEEEMRDDRTRT